MYIIVYKNRVICDVMFAVHSALVATSSGKVDVPELCPRTVAKRDEVLLVSCVTGIWPCFVYVIYTKYKYGERLL